MKKSFIFIPVILVLAVLVSFHASAYSDLNTDEYAYEINDNLFSVIDNGTKDILEEFGIEDYTQAYNASFSNLVSYFSTNLKEKSVQAVKCFFLLSVVTLLIAGVKTLAADSNNNDAFETVSVAVSALISINCLSPAINSMISVLSLSGNFIKGYIPIFAGIIALSGKPSSALTYNTVTLAAAEILSSAANEYAVFVIGAFVCLSIGFSFSHNIDIDRFTRAFHRIISIVFGFCASVFASLLTVRGTISASVDSASVKSVRYLISTMIPVVGSSISEAYSSILGSIGLIKGSVAVIGIFSALIINIPALVQGLLYYTLMNILSVTGIALDCKRLSGFYSSLCCALKFILLLIVFEVFLLVISTGLMLSFRE